MDPLAHIWNPRATVHDSSACAYYTKGCMNSSALNYNPLAAVEDDGGGGGGGGGSGRGDCVMPRHGCLIAQVLI